MSDGPRRVLGVLVGMIAAIVVVTVVEAVRQRVYPPPPDFDYRDAEKLRIYTSILPTGAWIFMLFAWLPAAFVGTWLGGSTARDRHELVCGVVCLPLLLTAITKMWSSPHPAWLWISALAGIPLCGWLALRQARRRSKRSHGATAGS